MIPITQEADVLAGESFGRTRPEAATYQAGKTSPKWGSVEVLTLLSHGNLTAIPSVADTGH